MGTSPFSFSWEWEKDDIYNEGSIISNCGPERGRCWRETFKPGITDTYFGFSRVPDWGTLDKVFVRTFVRYGDASNPYTWSTAARSHELKFPDFGESSGTDRIIIMHNRGYDDNHGAIRIFDYSAYHPSKDQGVDIDYLDSNQWYCMEFMLEDNGDSDLVKLWVVEAGIDSLEENPTWISPPASYFSSAGWNTADYEFAYRNHGVASDENFYFDDVVISNNFIGCGASTPDTTLPSAPTNLSAAPVSSSQINLSWTASTDNVGVTGYRLERCQGSTCTNYAQVASPAGTTYSDTGLSANTTYRYRVRAQDAAGNLSSYSSVVSGTTQTVSVGDWCDSQPASVVFCEDFDQNDYTNLIWGGGNETHVFEWTHETAGGYGGSGTAKFQLVQFDYEDGAGIVFDFPNNDRVNVGYMIYYGSNYNPVLDNDDGTKQVLIYDEGSSNFTRPMVMNRHMYSGTYTHRVMQSCQVAGGGCADEFGNPFPNPDANYTYTPEMYAGQWVYYEFEVEIGGQNTLYIYTQDGVVSGTYASVSNINNPARLFDYGRILAYMEGAGNDGIITNESYVKLDNVRVSHSFMGPPPGFVTGSPPYITNLNFTPSLEGASVQSKNFTITIYQNTTQMAQFSGTPNTSNQIPLPSIITNLNEGGIYDITADSNYYLRSRQNSITLNSNSIITLSALRAGDLNNDGIVNSLDWSPMNQNWFTNSYPSDINQDGVVNAVDFSWLNRNWLMGDG